MPIDYPTLIEKELVNEAFAAVRVRKETSQHRQILKNHDYFTGGELIDKSLRGGYSRFSTGNIVDIKSTLQSPKGVTNLSDQLWRAPAQKDDERWLDFTVRKLIYVNYVQLIVQKRAALLYKRTPKRTFSGPLATELETLYQDEDIGAKSLFTSFQVNSILGGTVAILPIWSFERERLAILAYPRKMFNPVWDDLTDELKSFTLFGQKYDPMTGRQTDFYQIWTAEYSYVLGPNGALQEEPAEHFCGKIPVCFWKSNTYELPNQNMGAVIASDIVNNNEDLNVMLSDLFHVAGHQSFSLLFTVNIDKAHRSGPGARLEAKEITEDRPAKAEYLNPNAKLAELQDIITAKMDQLFQAGRVPKGVVFPDNTAKSGVHLVIQWFPIQELYEEDKTAGIDNEKRLIETISMVLSRWRSKSPSATIPEAELEINYDEASILPHDEEAKILKDEWDIGMGLKSPVELLIERDPDLDEAAAIEKYKHVQELNKKAGFTPGGGTAGEFKSKSLRGDLLAQIEEEGEE